MGFHLGADFSEKLKLSVFLSRARMGGGNGSLRKNFHILVNDKEVELELRNSIDDFFVVQDVFGNEEYEPTLPKQAPKVIFDLGANIGCTAILFKTRYPDADLYCFEPDPDNFERLVDNTKQFSKVTCYKYALGARKEQKTFYVSDVSHMRNSFSVRGPSDRAISVDVVSLADAIAMTGVNKIDFLKFDIEGAESEMFATFKDWDRIGAFAGEIHPKLIPDRGEALVKLLRQNFEVTVTHDNGVHFTCRGSRKARITP
jgi:FkbM family methyltransferase